jgi:hypothetical protein
MTPILLMIGVKELEIKATSTWLILRASVFRTIYNFFIFNNVISEIIQEYLHVVKKDLISRLEIIIEAPLVLNLGN